jgi:type IV pilus assembly protein PilM
MRVLGLDFGTQSVKAVEIEAGFGRYEIHDYHEEMVLADSTVEAAASRLIQGLSKYPDKIVVGLPAQKTTFRNLTIPSRDRKSVHAAITFELEDDLPFAAEDAFFTHSILSQSKKQTQVHIVSTLKKHIAKTLINLEANGIEPDVLTTEAWAYRTLLNQVLSEEHQKRPVILVQIGHFWTTIYIHYKGIPLTARKFNWGGKDLTASIASHYKISTEEAERAKKDKGFILPPSQRSEASEEQIQFSDPLSHAFSRVLKEIRQSQLSTRNVVGAHASHIYLSGGSSLLPGLTSYLAEQTGTPCHTLQALSAVSHSGVPYSETTDSGFALAAGLALGMVGPDRAKLINLRKNDFAKRSGGVEINFASLKKPAFASIAVLTCFLISAGFQSIAYDSKINEMEPQLRNAMSGVFGYLSSSAARSFLADPGRLETRVRTQLQTERQKAILFEKNTYSPLNFMAALSKAIPSSIKVDLTEFEVGDSGKDSFEDLAPQNAKITFLLQNPSDADALRQVISNFLESPQSSEVQAAAATAEGESRWVVVYSGQTKEISYEL